MKANLNKRIKKQKKAEPQIDHYSDATLSLNASAYLPNLPFVDPLQASMPNKGFAREFSIIKAMSSPLKKPPFPMMQAAIVLVIAAIALSIVYSQVISPYMESQQEFEIKKLEGNLTSADKPPSLFDIKKLPIPGLKSN